MNTNEHFSLATDVVPLYNLVTIEQFCRGNKVQIKKMMQQFVNQVPQDMVEMKAALHIKDFTSMQHAAHRIKPILNYYAIPQAEEDAKKVEALAKEGLETDELVFTIKRLDEMLIKVVETMKTDMLAYA